MAIAGPRKKVKYNFGNLYCFVLFREEVTISFGLK